MNNNAWVKAWKELDRRINDELDMERVFYNHEHEQHLKGE